MEKINELVLEANKLLNKSSDRNSHMKGKSLLYEAAKLVEATQAPKGQSEAGKPEKKEKTQKPPRESKK